VENSAGWLWLVVVAAAAACASSSATFSIHPIGRALSLPSNGCRRHGIHASFPGVCSRCTVPVRAWAKSGLLCCVRERPGLILG
jgi:hypothetical protein